jgi:RNase P/RNase MRP subunit POP5
MSENETRQRKRYIAFSVKAPRDITRKEFISAIRKNIADKDQWGRIEPWLTVFENNMGILRCIHTGCNEAKMLLTSIEKVGREGEKIQVKTLGTSGTIKKAKLRYLK